jgi:hypothetical protein
VGYLGGAASGAQGRTACNTRGVCHQLSGGFDLKHGRLSGDEDVKVKPMEASPNLNLDVAPLLYI